MPLIVPQLPKIIDLNTTLGKKIVDESKIPDPSQLDYPVDNVIFKSQLPDNILILKQDVEKTAIVGTVKSGYFPLIVDDDDIVVQVF